MSVAATEAGTPSSEATSIAGTLASFLQNPPVGRLDQAPQGFDNALASLPTTADETGRSLSKSNFWVWLAYSLTGASAQGLSESDIRYVVEKVSSIQIHQSWMTRIHDALYNVTRSSQRLRQVELAGLILPTFHATAPEVRLGEAHDEQQHGSRQSKRPRVEGGQRETAIPSAPLQSAHDQPVVDKSPSIRDRPGLPPFDMLAQDHAWPEAAQLSLLFPPFMCRIISKDFEKKTAAIKLSFPDDPNMCHLVLDITAGAVPRVARELFDIHIQDVNNQRSISTSSDRTIHVGTSVTVSGAELASVEKLFGAVLARAIRAHPTQTQERLMGMVYTDYYSMQIWAETELPARLTLRVNAENLNEIPLYLFPFRPSAAGFISAS